MKFCVIFLLLVSSTAFSQQKQSYLFLPDRVFDGTEMHEGWSVLVENDKITGAGSKESIKTAPGALLISMPGMTLLPGLIEGHSHLLLYPYNITDWDTQVLKESDSYRTARATVHAKKTHAA